MKIQNDCKGVISSNSTSKTKQFGICSNPIAYKILTNNLYTNKIGTIIRELSCNAYDSHVQAGCPKKPFDIHVPSLTEPVFYIQDYGTGLTDQEIDKIYTKYFLSTKTDTNDLIGGLGLGSKTPLCYVDAFFVESNKNGITSIYKIYKGDDGIPTYSLEEKAKTGIPDGLKITFPVEKKDIEDFAYEITNFFMYNDLRPNFKNVNLTIPELDLISKIGNLTIFKSDNSSSRKTVRIRLGKVAYPLYMDRDLRSVEFEKKCEEYCKEDYSLRRQLENFIYDLYYNTSYNRCLILDFPIGSLEVTASREALSLDEKSKSILINELFDVALGIYQQAKKDKENIKTILDFIKYQQKYEGISKLGYIDMTLEDTVKVQDNLARVNPDVFKHLAQGRLTKPLSYSFFERSSKGNCRYKRSLAIPYARKVVEFGYLYKVYLSTGTITAFDYWINKNVPVPYAIFLKANKKDLKIVEKELKKLPKGLFDIEVIEPEKPATQKISVPLFDSIEVSGIRITTIGKDEITGRNEYEYGYTTFYKSNFENLANKTIYYIPMIGRDFSGYEASTLLFALKDKNLSDFLLGLRPRQISTLEKCGFKVVEAADAVGHDFIARNNFKIEIYNSLQNRVCSLLSDIRNLTCFSDDLKQEAKDLERLIELKYKRKRIYYGKGYYNYSFKDTIATKMERKILDVINSKILNEVAKEQDLLKTIISGAFSYSFQNYYGDRSETSQIFNFLVSNRNKLGKVISYVKKELDSFVKI